MLPITKVNFEDIYNIKTFQLTNVQNRRGKYDPKNLRRNIAPRNRDKQRAAYAINSTTQDNTQDELTGSNKTASANIPKVMTRENTELCDVRCVNKYKHVFIIMVWDCWDFFAS